MKKKYIYMAVAAAFFTACQEDAFVQQNGSADKELHMMEITAGVGGDSRTVFEDGKVKWQDDDALSVFIGGDTNYKFTLSENNEEKNEAVFEGEAAIGSSFANNVAYYPYGENVAVAYSNGSYTVTAQFPSVQQWAEDGSFGKNSLPMVAVTANTDIKDKFQFNTLGGWLQLYVKGTAKITKVVMKAKNHKIAGDYTVTAAYGQHPTMEMAETAVRYVALDCGEGVQLEEGNATLFTFTVAPFSFDAGDVSFDIYDNEGKFMQDAYTISKGASIIANAYYGLSKNNAVVYKANGTPVAKIGEMGFGTVQSAINYAIEGETITLVNDVTTETTLTVSEEKNIIIDLNGKVINGTMHKNNGHVITNNGVLKLIGGTVKSTANNGGSAFLNNGTMIVEGTTLNGAPNADGSWPSYTINNKSVLTLTDANITSYHGAVASYGANAVAILNNTNIDMAGIPEFTSHAIYTYNDGKVVVNGGNIANKATDQNSTGGSVINGNVEVNDGEFSGCLQNYYGTPVLKGGTFNVTPNTKFVAEGYTVIKKNGLYKVIIASEMTIGQFVDAVIEANGTYDGQGKIVKIVPTSGQADETNDCTIPNRLQKYTNPEVYYAQYQRFKGLENVAISNVNFVFVPAAVNVKDAWNTAGATTTAKNINGELQFMNSGSVTLSGCTFDKVAVSPINAPALNVNNCSFNDLQAYAIKDINANNVTIHATTFTNCNGGFWFNNAPAEITVTDNTFTGVGRRGAMQFSATGDYSNTTMTVTGNTVAGGAFLWQLNPTVNADQFNAILDPEKNTFETAYVEGSTIPAAPVARINGKPYTSLVAALEAANANETIDLVSDITATEVIMIGKSVTINGNEHKVSSNATRVFRITTSDIEVTLEDVEMVSRTTMTYPNDVRGVSIDPSLSGIKLTLNNCSVDFTDASACDWSYAVNISGSGSGHTVIVNGGSYEGANVVNAHGANNSIIVKNAVLTSLYPDNDMYYGACIWVLQNNGSSVEATDNTFNGANAIAFNLGTGTSLTESGNTDNTTKKIAKVGNTYYASLAEAVATSGTVKLLQNVTLNEGFTVPASSTIVLDLNGKTISQTKECTASYGMIENKGNLTITGNGKINFTDSGAGDPNFGWGSYTIVNRGTLVVENGTIEHLGAQAFGKHMICAIQQSAGTTTINGGTISTPNYRSLRANGGAIEINGGTFDGQVWMQPNQSDITIKIAEGTFEPNGKDASSVFMTNSGENYTVVSASITGGTFNGKIGVSDANKQGVAGSISGGLFTDVAKDGTNAALIAKGYKFVSVGNGNWSVIKETTTEGGSFGGNL